MPTPTLPLTPLSTNNTFRAWLTSTNTIIDLINSGAILVSGAANGAAIGAFAIGNTSDTTSSLTIAGGKFFSNATGTFLTGTTTLGANLTVNASAANVVFGSNATYLLSNTTFIGGSNLTINTAITVNGTLTLSVSTPLTVGNLATFSSNVSVANNLVASNTVYARSIVFNLASSVVANTLSGSQYDNYTQTGLDDAMALNLNPDTQDIAVTGIVAPANMTAGIRILYLQNVSGSYKVSLRNANTSSIANNRIATGGLDVDVLPGASVPLLYSFSTNRWRPLAAPSDSSIQSVLTVTGNGSIGGVLTVTGNTVLNANVAIDTNVLFVDSVNNRVGINTIPTSPFHVVGNAVFANTLSVLQTLSVSGAVNALSMFGVTGAATFASTALVNGLLTANAGATVNGAVSVTGAATIGTSLTVTGATQLNGTTTVTSYGETPIDLGVVGASATINIAAGTVITATLTNGTTTTFTMPTAVAGKSFTMFVKQPASTGSGAASFSGVRYGTAGAPTVTTGANKVDIFSFTSDGTSWYGAYLQGF